MEYQVIFKLGGKTYWVWPLTSEPGFVLRDTQHNFYYLNDALSAKDAFPRSKVYWNNGGDWIEWVKYS